MLLNSIHEQALLSIQKVSPVLSNNNFDLHKNSNIEIKKKDSKTQNTGKSFKSVLDSYR